MELECDGSAFLPLQIVNVRIGDRLELFLLLRDAPAFLDELAQCLLPDVLGELLADHGGRHLALAEAGQAGALLIGPRRALLGRLHVVRGDRHLERRFAGLGAGFLDQDGVRHVARNLIVRRASCVVRGGSRRSRRTTYHARRTGVRMRPEGLEPPRVAPPAPKAGASANSATVANSGEMYNFPSPSVVPIHPSGAVHVSSALPRARCADHAGRCPGAGQTEAVSGSTKPRLHAGTVGVVQVHGWAAGRWYHAHGSGGSGDARGNALLLG